MLAQCPITTILPVVDLERARRFYAEVLGLAESGRTGEGQILFRGAGGGQLALFQRPEPTRAVHTAVSFEVPDAPAAVRELRARGVRFEEYDLPGLKTTDSICVLGSERAAWFKDSEGNLLCVHETLGAALDRVSAPAASMAQSRSAAPTSQGAA
jgi:catechol 2,3-dioxygenase-like lactoylglutathione lyase family enzyme